MSQSTLLNCCPSPVKKIVGFEDLTRKAKRIPQLHLHMNYIDGLSEKGRITNLGRALFGSGGTGKSSLLLFIANYCKRNNWFVFYMPLGSNTAEQVFTDNVADVIVSTFFTDNKNAEELYGKELEESKGVDKLLRLLKALYSETNHKVLIAIDQWNIFLQNLRLSKGRDNDFLEFFNTFQTSGKMLNGIFIGALSSQSFFSLPIDVFPDATKQNHSITLKPFSNEELNGYIDLACSNGTLKDTPSEQKVEDYQYQSGSIPRLLHWMLTDPTGFKKKISDYYGQRMKKFMERSKDSTTNTGSNLLSYENIATSVYLNKRIVCAEADVASWVESGLLVQVFDKESEEGNLVEFDAPCPIARSAIYQQLRSTALDMVTFLMSDKI